MKALASTWNHRIAALPELPSAQEQGFKDIFIGHWTGLFAPKGTPEAILEKLNAALKSPELRARLIPMAIDPQGGTRED